MGMCYVLFGRWALRNSGYLLPQEALGSLVARVVPPTPGDMAQSAKSLGGCAMLNITGLKSRNYDFIPFWYS